MCGTMQMSPPGSPRAIQPKYKRKNSERRKEKSRDAARDRRAKESQFFQDLEDLLPMSGVSGTAQNAFDKTSLIRLSLANLKCRDVVEKGLMLPAVKEESQELMNSTEMLDSMGAFCLVLSEGMDVIFISNNVESYIGLGSVELMGQSFCDYVHPCDHHQLKAVVNLKEGRRKETYVRIKVTVTERGRMINLRQANYKVLKISGIVRNFESGSKGGLNGNIFLGLAQLIGRDTLAQNAVNFPLSGVFRTRHSVDMKFMETDLWLSSVGQYPFHHLQGVSFYELIHAEDCQKVQKALKKLCEQGQCETPPYRFLVAGGGWVWIQTRANQSSIRKGSTKGHTISCTHTAISEVINKGDVVALIQIATESRENKNAKKKQKIENVRKTESIIPEAKPFEDIYNVLQMLDEQPSILPKEEEELFSPTIPKYTDHLDVYPTKPAPPAPSVIVTPTNPKPKVSTESLLRRSSVIVAPASMSILAAPKQMSSGVLKKGEESPINEPRAVTTALFTNTDEPGEVCTVREPAIKDVNQDKPEKIDIQIDEGEMFCLSNAESILDEIIPLEQELFNPTLSPFIGPWDYSAINDDHKATFGGHDLKKMSPFCSDLVKIEDHQQGSIVKEKEVPMFDFCDEPVGKQERCKGIENGEDNCEEFFKILEETMTPKKYNPVDYCQKDDGRNPLVREDTKIMWGRNKEDQEPESYLSQFYNKYNEFPIAPTNFHRTIDRFHYNQCQGKTNIINENFESVVENSTSEKTLPIAKSEFPELQKLLGDESIKKVTPTPYHHIFEVNPLKNPKRIMIDYNNDQRNIILLQKN